MEALELVVSMEHIVVEQQRNGNLVGIGVAAEIAGGGNSWHTMVVKMIDAEEIVDGKNSQN